MVGKRHYFNVLYTFFSAVKFSFAALISKKKKILSNNETAEKEACKLIEVAEMKVKKRKEKKASQSLVPLNQ